MRLLLFCFAASLGIALCATPTCLEGAPEKRSCKRNVVILIDETEYMGSHDAVEAEIDFIRNFIIPELNVDNGLVSVGFEVYGTGKLSLYEESDNRGKICNNLDDIANGVNMINNGSETLVKTLTNLCKNFDLDSTSIVLFTASTDQQDINSAGTYLYNQIAKDGVTGFSAVVVNYANGVKFAAPYWDERYTKEYTRSNISDIDLAGKIDDTICDPIYTAPPPTTTVAAPTTKQPTNAPATNPPVTERAATTTRNGPYYPPAPSTGDYMGCTCVEKSIWLDVIVLVDSSEGMGHQGTEEVSNFIASVFSTLTIGYAEKYNTRLGVIAYSDSVVQVYDLDYFTSTAQMIQELTVPYLNQSGTNMEGALVMAVNMFEAKARISARQVVMMIASDYKVGEMEDPTRAATTFKDDGGVIITVSYKQIHGEDVPNLKHLASPNYNVSNVDLNIEYVRFLLCEANCFCPRNYAPYNPDAWNAPVGGCYSPVTIPSFQFLAEKHCSHYHDSVVAIVESPAKAEFLLSLHDARYAQWIGLTYDQGQWLWPLGYSLGYSNWAPGQDLGGADDCVYMLTNGTSANWIVSDCYDDFNFVCQASSCDSTRYCNYYDE